MARLLDNNNNIIVPTLLLKRRNLDTIGNIIGVTDLNTNVNFNGGDEISCTVHKYVDGILNPLWDKIETLRVLYHSGLNENFQIKVNTVSEATEIKNITGFDLCKAELSMVHIYDTEINTEGDTNRDDWTHPTVIYDQSDPKHSLLHRVLEKVPNYTIGHVDATLAGMIRAFSINGTSIYDFLTNTLSAEIGCIFIFDTLTRTINCYDLENRCVECGARIGTSEYCTECGSTEIAYGYGNDTSIFITNENIAQNISREDTDDQHFNCFRVSGGDDLITATVANCNPNGSRYIYRFNDSQLDDMSPELSQKIKDYEDVYNYYNNEYPSAMPLASQYNAVINKYYTNIEEKNRKHLNPTLTGYKEVIAQVYEAMDVNDLINLTLSPDVALPDDNSAEAEVRKLTPALLGTMATNNLSSLILSIANNIVLSYAKVFVNTAKFKITIDDSVNGYPRLSGNVWTGRFVVTNRVNAEDTATGIYINLPFNEDEERFLDQKIKKTLKEYEVDYTEYQWDKYSLSRLSGFREAYMEVQGVLISQGVSVTGHPLYSIYVTYRDRLIEIEKAMGERERDLDIVKKVQTDLDNAVTNIHKELDFEKYIGETLWQEFLAYKRETEYTNSNYISDGLNTSAVIDKARELLARANKELIQASTMQHTLSASINNLLTCEDFRPLWSQFEVGNWIRVKSDDDIIKLRLIGYSFDYEDLANCNITFSDVIASTVGTSDIQSVLSKASSMASSYDTVERQSKYALSNKHMLENWFSKGLDATTVKIVNNANNQAIVYDDHGILCREYDSDTETYADAQMKIINQGIYLTDNNWESTITAIGKMVYFDAQQAKYITSYGVNADTIVGRLFLGEKLKITNVNNDVTIDEKGLTISNGISTFKVDPTTHNMVQILKNDVPQMYIDSNGNIKYSGGIIGSDIVNSNISSGNISASNIDWTGVNTPTYVQLKQDGMWVKDLDADVANIIDLNVDTATIRALDTHIANIDFLTMDTAIAQNIQTLTLTSTETTTFKSFISDLTTKYITAQSIFGDHISTNDFTIKSDDGNLEIADNTITIKDSNDRTRIQIGEDASGQFSFLVLDEEGTGTIIDSNGVTEKGIADGLIRSEKLASKNATYSGIEADKLNINSVVTGINNDGSSYIKSNKVWVDEATGSLNTALTTMTTNISSVSGKLKYSVIISSSNGTSIDDTTVLTANVYDYGTQVPATGTFTYQWYFNGNAITGATQQTYTVTLTGDDIGGNYACIVSYAD